MSLRSDNIEFFSQIISKILGLEIEYDEAKKIVAAFNVIATTDIGAQTIHSPMKASIRENFDRASHTVCVEVARMDLVMMEKKALVQRISERLVIAGIANLFPSHPNKISNR